MRPDSPDDNYENQVVRTQRNRCGTRLRPKSPKSLYNFFKNRVVCKSFDDCVKSSALIVTGIHTGRSRSNFSEI
jgi:hypothetical protein